ncbi:UDP-N-acetylglucosamine 1-carboxyvinyltransferase, partial [bacterium]|nr:UDP-N-acetylglucosamine 1-carboxyvinyltransferase [bacterium]
MCKQQLVVQESAPLRGTTRLWGAKNAVLVIMASLLLTRGKSRLTNVPSSCDVWQMIEVLKELGAAVVFDHDLGVLDIDTSKVFGHSISEHRMQKMRASVLVMGPLLARFGKAELSMPGGCVIGSRPIDFHIKLFRQLGIQVTLSGNKVQAEWQSRVGDARLILEYPSVGATENALMAAALSNSSITLVNAAVEPEVLDLVEVLKKMGADITVQVPATIIVRGVQELRPIEHSVIPDRLEAGALLIAAAITKGSITIPDAPVHSMGVFLEKLREMGHVVVESCDGVGVHLTATSSPRAVSFKTSPYPGFPTDLQAPMMVAQAVAKGESSICETVFENRMIHVRELQKMGAQIRHEGMYAHVHGVNKLYGASVIGTDIRACAALVIAGLVAQGVTTVTGLDHLHRGFANFEGKLRKLGANISESRVAKSDTQ